MAEDLCFNTPCGSYGTCKQEKDKFECDCVNGYTGDLCETGMLMRLFCTMIRELSVSYVLFMENNFAMTIYLFYC